MYVFVCTDSRIDVFIWLFSFSHPLFLSISLIQFSPHTCRQQIPTLGFNLELNSLHSDTIYFFLKIYFLVIYRWTYLYVIFKDRLHQLLSFPLFFNRIRLCVKFLYKRHLLSTTWGHPLHLNYSFCTKNSNNFFFLIYIK